MSNTHKPQRTCIGCMMKNDKDNLIRIVRSTDGTVKIDNKNNSDGRGSYICANSSCIENAKKKNALKRTLKCDELDDVYQKLLEVVQNEQNI